MHRISASQFPRAFGVSSDKAIKVSLAIAEQGRDHLGLLSADEFACLKRHYRVGDLRKVCRTRWWG